MLWFGLLIQSITKLLNCVSVFESHDHHSQQKKNLLISYDGCFHLYTIMSKEIHVLFHVPEGRDQLQKGVACGYT